MLGQETYSSSSLTSSYNSNSVGRGKLQDLVVCGRHDLHYVEPRCPEDGIIDGRAAGYCEYDIAGVFVSRDREFDCTEGQDGVPDESGKWFMWFDNPGSRDLHLL
jgi:hypothetical protein